MAHVPSLYRFSRRLSSPLGVRAAAAVISGAGLGLALWGFIEPRLILDIRRIGAALPRLPAEWVGRRIAILADWQVGMWWANIGMVRRAVRAVIAERPAALLLAGDFVYAGRDDLPGQVRLLGDLMAPLATAGLPVFAVLGNHDWVGANGVADETRAQTITRALESAGVRVLRNEAVAMRPPDDAAGPPLYVVGLGARRPGRDDAHRALSGVPATAARLVLMHQPASFGDIPAHAAPVAIAGHSHGGQIRLPIVSRWFWLGYSDRERLPREGWVPGHDGAPGNALYVNRGIGFSRWPIRINAPPELTVLTLQVGHGRHRGGAGVKREPWRS